MSSRSLYVCCPGFATRGPLDRQNQLDQVAWLAHELGWLVTPSPLLDRHLGPGGWLPARERASDLEEALAHDAIWACRGGYGSIELVETVLKSPRSSGPVLIGYSDLTALHAAFAVRGWHRTFYGTVATGPNRGGRSGSTMLASLRDEGFTRTSANDAAARVLRPGGAEGRLFPACLSVLASLVGTPAMPDLNNCILAIEDVRTHPFLIASNLNQLFLAGALSGVRALLGGTFTHRDNHDYLGPSPDEILCEWSTRLGVPLITRLPFGHLDDGLVLPYHRRTSVDADRDGTWVITVHATA